MGAHIIDGEFQSDKYPTTPRGKVPLSVKDKTAQDLLWVYAQRRRAVDAEFADDLESALRENGYAPGNGEARDRVAGALVTTCAAFYGDRVPDTFDMTLSDLMAKAAIEAFTK